VSLWNFRHRQKLLSGRSSAVTRVSGCRLDFFERGNGEMTGSNLIQLSTPGTWRGSWLGPFGPGPPSCPDSGVRLSNLGTRITWESRVYPCLLH